LERRSEATAGASEVERWEEQRRKTRVEIGRREKRKEKRE
jgi:hypothetical protein